MSDDWKAQIDAYLSPEEKLRRWQLDKNNRCNYPGCDFVSPGEESVPGQSYNPSPGEKLSDLSRANRSVMIVLPRGVRKCMRCSTPVCESHRYKGICRICAEKGLG
jgi:hypothetical protein